MPAIQDALGRHVVIKLVHAESDEFRILQHLTSKQSLDTLRENWVTPVLGMLPIGGFWFVVMPHWGSIIQLPRPSKLHEVITIMHSILKGLAFLHENGIAHHDILMRNVLVNHFSDMWQLIFANKTRQALREDGSRLIYAVFNFDHSVLLPPGIKKGDFRLPYYRSWGDFNRTFDTATGEFDYDPFVLDVGILGIEFCMFFQHLAPVFPRLAPLLDMMTTRHLDRRFTASQALHFFEEWVSKILEFNLNMPILILTTNAYYDEYNRWCNLMPDSAEKWKHYKQTPVPWTTLALRRFCRTRYIVHIVPWIRRFVSRLFSDLFPPRQALPSN